MAKKKADASKADAVTVEHDHDRIAMPSRNADGTLDQTDPEYIIEDGEELAKEQAEAQARYATDASRSVEEAQEASKDAANDEGA